MVAVAQSVRASDCGSEGRGFDPHQPPRRATLRALRGDEGRGLIREEGEVVGERGIGSDL